MRSAHPLYRFAETDHILGQLSFEAVIDQVALIVKFFHGAASMAARSRPAFYECSRRLPEMYLLPKRNSRYIIVRDING